METKTDFIFLGSKITADGDCSHEIKRRLLLGRKAVTNLDSILKSRDITLPTKIHLVKGMIFPAVVYGCELGCEESWAPKNWCFWTVVLEKTLESPLDCKEGLGAGGEGDHRGWDGWMASLTQWTWVWVNSGSWWWTGRPGVLRFMELQRVGHDWATEMNWTELNWHLVKVSFCSLYFWEFDKVIQSCEHYHNQDYGRDPTP